MKKWSYAAAMMLALAGGSIFTGCIDNDEPYGMEQVRLATAELLKAKAQAADAEKAANDAKVEMAKIQAEIDKLYAEAELEKIKSETKINEIYANAQAAKDQAEAEKLLAIADAIRTEAQAKYEAAQAEIQNKRDIVEKKLEFADQKLAELKYAFEKSQLQDADAQKSALYWRLADNYQQYIYALNQYNQKLNAIAKQQQEIDKANIDLKWVWTNESEKQGMWVSPKYDNEEAFNNLLDFYAKQKEGINEAIKVLEEANTKLENIQASDLFTMLDEYTKAKNDLDLNIAQLNVEKDAIRINNPAVFDAADAAYKVIADTLANERPIPAYTFVPTAELAALGFTKDQEVVKEGETYTLEVNSGADIQTAVPTASSSYRTAEDAYMRVIGTIKNFLMDDFDKAWTEARKNELKNELAAANNVWAAAEADWTLAKTIYNNGQTPVIPDDLAGEADYEAAMNAFNTAMAAVAPAVEAESAAADEVTEKRTAYYDAFNNFYAENPNTVEAKWAQAQDDYVDAKIYAEKNYQDARTAADETFTAGRTKLFRQGYELLVAMNTAEEVYNKLNAELALDPTNKTLQSEVTKAKGDWTSAEEAYNLFYFGNPAKEINSTYSVEFKKLSDAQEKAYAAAETTKAKALQDAEKAYAAAETAYFTSDAYQNDEKDPEYKPVTEAYDAWQAANDAYDAAYNALEEVKTTVEDSYDDIVSAFYAQQDALGFIMFSSFPGRDVVTDYLNGDIEKPADAMIPMMMTLKDAEVFTPHLSGWTIPTGFTQATYVNAKNFVIQASEKAFGDLASTDDEPEYQDQAVLVDAVTPEMINDYIAKNILTNRPNSEVEPYECYPYYLEFGAYGDVLYIQSRLDVADAMLANADIAQTNIDAVKANIDIMAQSLENALANVVKVQDEYAAAAEAVNDLYTDIDQKIYLAEQLVAPYDKIVGSLQAAVNKLYNNESDVQLSEGENAQKVIKEAIQAHEGMIAWYNEMLEVNAKATERAEYQLAQLKAGITLEASESSLQIELDKLTAEADVLKQQVDFYLTRVEDLTKEYNAAMGKE